MRETRVGNILLQVGMTRTNFSGELTRTSFSYVCHGLKIHVFYWLLDSLTELIGLLCCRLEVPVRCSVCRLCQISYWPRCLHCQKCIQVCMLLFSFLVAASHLCSTTLTHYYYKVNITHAYRVRICHLSVIAIRYFVHWRTSLVRVWCTLRNMFGLITVAWILLISMWLV